MHKNNNTEFIGGLSLEEVGTNGFERAQKEHQLLSFTFKIS